MINIFEETMAHMTYLQIEEAAREGFIVLFPTGVIEEHGPHLPLAVDVYGAYLQSRAVKSELEKRGIRSLIAPPFYWGVNAATSAFGGSFNCKQETMIAVLTDAMENLKRWGFDRVFFLNHHMDGSHVQALDQAIRKARQGIGIQAYWIVDDFMAKRLGFKGDEPHLLLHQSSMPLGTSSPYLSIHAEAYETGLMVHYVPHLVDLEIMRMLKPTNLKFEDLMAWRKGGMEARKVTPQGYFGDPASANPEESRKEIETYGRMAAEVIEACLQGRYAAPKA